MIGERQEIVQRFDRTIDEWRDAARCARVSAELLTERATMFERMAEEQERAKAAVLAEYDGTHGGALRAS